MARQVNLKLSNETVRNIITDLLNYYKVPEDLKRSYWRAFDAAHNEQETQTVTIRGC